MRDQPEGATAQPWPARIALPARPIAAVPRRPNIAVGFNPRVVCSRKAATEHSLGLAQPQATGSPNDLEP
jgi:hypothetical protein